MSKQSPLKKLGFSAFLFLCFFGAAEALCRLIWNYEDPLIDYDIGIQMEPSFSRIWQMKPGVTENFGHDVTIGANGLRLPSGKGEDVKWMTLGDSSIFGHGLSDEGTLHYQLQSQLADNGHQATVYCGGVPGYSILQSTLLMNEVGWDLHPDILVIGNLWSDNNFDNFVDKQWLADLNSPVAKVSHFMARFRIWTWANSLLNPYKAPTNNKNDDARITWVREPLKKGQRRVPLGDYGRALDSLMVEAANRNIGVIIMQPGNRNRLEGLQRGVMWDPYFELQRKLATRRGVPIMDVLPGLKNADLTAGDAFLDDMHPSKISNRIIAHDIIDVALEYGWPENTLLASTQQPLYSGKPRDPYDKGIQLLESKNNR